MKVVLLLWLTLAQGAPPPAGRTPAEAIRAPRPPYPREALRSFSKKKPVTIVFDAEQLQQLTPDWAVPASASHEQ